MKRSLPVVDPSNRTLYISVGCAIANLLIAWEHFGFKYDLTFFPNGQANDCVYKVKFFKRRAEPVVDELFQQIAKRFTVKDKYIEKNIDGRILQDLKDFIDVPKFYLHFMIDRASKLGISDLVTRAHSIQLANKDFRRELSKWLSTNWTTHPDGMPLHTFGVPDTVSLGFPTAFEKFDLSKVVISRSLGLIQGCSGLGILSFIKDDKLAWIRCGILLENLFLKATSYYIRLSFFSQPIGHAGLREELMSLISEGYPQLLFGFGYSDQKRLLLVGF